MPGKDKLEFDVLANDKASKVFDRVANAGKDVGKAVESGADKGSRALKKLQDSGKKASESLSKMGEGAKEGVGKLGEAFKAGPLAWIGIGAGIGGLVMEGFGQAMENQDANHLLTAQLGASNADMAKLGKISGDLYKNAFGESVSEVDQVMKTVFQAGLANVSDAEDKIKGVTTQVMNYSKISGEEALPVTRAISQMLKTGLAKNATEAFDLLTKGVQKGLDKSEDLLDTVNEYGTQFRKLGLDGPQAFGLISQAIKAGARDSDIAADAIKEFSIRAIDGSTQTAQGFKGLGLSAKSMAETIAQGGPKAAGALQLTLDKLRGIKDPAKQAQLAVMLFGTQAEDLGGALYAMNLGTATKEFGQVAGAAQRAGDVINDTASNKLATVGRTIKQAIVDGISKYALPQLEKFADWFNGPGKDVMLSWAISGASAIVDFGDKTLGVLSAIIPAFAKVGAGALAVGAAIALNFGDPKMAKNMLEQAKVMNQWGDTAQDSIGKARKELQTWKTTIDKTNTKVKLQADITDLDQKIAKAQAELRDPGLTKERRAKLTAEIAQLQKQKAAAIRQLNDPGLVKTRTAKLEADKRVLDQKIAAAKKALADPKLTAERKAKLNADISALLRQKANAQAAIDKLHGKTVPITIKYNYVGGAPKGQTGDTTLGGLFPARAAGGPVRKGQAYVVGEKRPELFVPEQDGRIIPSVEGVAPRGLNVGAAPATSVTTLSFDDSEISRFIVKMLRKGLQGGGAQNNLQLLIGGKPA